MAHKHSVYDTDLHFTIDPITKVIKRDAADTKIKIMQFDHNSERFTFELPRYIEGHDMSQCTSIEVNYENVSTDKIQKVGDVYIVKDMQLSPDSDDVVIFSWLISRNATSLAGTLQFSISFQCVTEEGIEYSWNTDINHDYNIALGLNCAETSPLKISEAVALLTRDIQDLNDKIILYTDEIALKEGKADADVVRERVSVLEDTVADHTRELQVLEAASRGNLYEYRTVTFDGTFEPPTGILPWGLLSHLFCRPSQELSFERNKSGTPWFDFVAGTVEQGTLKYGSTANITVQDGLLNWQSTAVGSAITLNSLAEYFQNGAGVFTTKITLDTVNSDLACRFSYSPQNNDKLYIFQMSGGNIYLGRASSGVLISVNIPTTLYFIADLGKKKLRCLEEATRKCLATIALDYDYAELFKTMCNPQILSNGEGLTKIGDISIFEGAVYPIGKLRRAAVNKIDSKRIPDEICNMPGYGIVVPSECTSDNFIPLDGTNVHTYLDFEKKQLRIGGGELTITGNETIREENGTVVFVDCIPGTKTWSYLTGICSDIDSLLGRPQYANTSTEMILGKGDRNIYWNGILDKLGMTLEEFVLWLKNRYASGKQLTIHYGGELTTIDVSAYLGDDYEYIRLDSSPLKLYVDNNKLSAKSQLKMTYRVKL